MRETEQGVFSLHIHMDGTQMQLSQFQYNVCSEIHHHIFIIVSSFCQGSLPCAAGSQDSKEIGCIIVDRCIDFLNIHGLLAY